MWLAVNLPTPFVMHLPRFESHLSRHARLERIDSHDATGSSREPNSKAAL
jgi:hypothetical protein